MGQPYVGEIRLFAGNFPISGWAWCDGALIPISENETLFQLIGTTYGGDGQSTFALPDLRGRVPLHFGQGPGLVNYLLGEAAGVEAVTLTTQQIPIHTHAAFGSDSGANSNSPAGKVPAEGAKRVYRAPGAPVPMAANAITPIGGSQPHENRQPYLGLNFIISLFGIFPSPT